MVIYTSFFGGPYANHPGAVAISRTVPPGWNGKRYTRLAPPRALVDGFKAGSVSRTMYTEIYNWYLDSLDIREEIGNILALMRGVDTEDVYLLCWEAPGKFCHRRLFAHAAEKVGVKIIEASIERR